MPLKTKKPIFYALPLWSDNKKKTYVRVFPYLINVTSLLSLPVWSD